MGTLGQLSPAGTARAWHEIRIIQYSDSEPNTLLTSQLAVFSLPSFDMYVCGKFFVSMAAGKLTTRDHRISAYSPRHHRCIKFKMVMIRLEERKIPALSQIFQGGQCTWSMPCSLASGPCAKRMARCLTAYYQERSNDDTTVTKSLSPELLGCGLGRQQGIKRKHRQRVEREAVPWHLAPCTAYKVRATIPASRRSGLRPLARLHRITPYTFRYRLQAAIFTTHI